MSKKSITFGTSFHNLPGFERNLRRSEKLLMFGHKVSELSKEELLACIVHVQDYADQQDKLVKKLEQKIAASALS